MDLQIHDINSLPHEVHQEIGSYLDNRSKRQMRLANTTWFKIINYTYFCIWIPRDAMMDALVDRLARYTQPISLRFKKQPNLDPEKFVKISQLTNLTTFQLAPENRIDDKYWLQFSTLTNLEYFWSCMTGVYFDNYPFKLLENFKKLRGLETYRLNFKFEELASVFEKLHHLESIKITAEAPDNVNLISKMHAEHLTSLELNFTNNQVLFSEADVDKFSNLKRFAWRNDLEEPGPVVFPIYKLTQLESLECSSEGHLQHIHLFTNLTQLTLWSVHEPNTDPLAKLTNLVSLTVTGEQYQFDFLRSMPLLQDLKVHARNDGEFLSIIPHESLTKLDLLTYVQPNSEYLTRFSGLQVLSFAAAKVCPKLNESIKHLTRLTSAEIIFWNSDLDLVDFSPLIELKELRLTSCTKQAVSTLHALTQLTKLQISIANETDFKFLENMPLKFLRMDCHDAPDLWPILAKMTSLEHLEIVLIGERDEQIKGLSGLTNLTALIVTGRITGEHFTALTSLQTVELTKVQTTAFYTEQELTTHLPNLLHFRTGTLCTWRGKQFM